VNNLVRQIRVFDRKLIQLIISKRRTGLTRFFLFITRLGDGWAYYLGAAVYLLSLPFDLNWIIRGGLSFGIQLGLYKLIKPLSRRRRPFHRYPGIKNLVVPPDLYSFPSGHTAAATVSVFVFSVHLPWLLPVLAFFAALVGLSRVYLGVHYPTDVLFGFVLGLISVWAGTWISSFFVIG